VSFLFCIISFLPQLGAVRREGVLALFVKIKIASYSIIFYLGKMLLPLKLSCFYPYPRISNYFVPAIYNLALLAAITLLIAVCISLRYTRRIIFGGFFFFLTVFPALQFIPLGATIVADRYTYIPSIGVFFIIALIFAWFIKKAGYNVYLKAALLSLGVLIVLNFTYFSRQRCRVWENGFTLWNDVINNYGAEYIPIAYYNRGLLYLKADKQKLAFFDFKKALELYHGWLGLKQNEMDTYKDFLSSGEDYIKLFNIMGIQFAEINRTEEAVILFKKIIEKNRKNLDAYLNLCVTYGNLGMYKYAIEYGNKAIELNPNLAAAHFNLAVAYYFEKERDLSLLHLEKAKSLGVNLPEDFLKTLEQNRPAVK
jgi:tetratricopeptide (TPR) repeat protein